jgi:hypothetical protein
VALLDDKICGESDPTIIIVSCGQFGALEMIGYMEKLQMKMGAAIDWCLMSVFTSSQSRRANPPTVYQ